MTSADAIKGKTIFETFHPVDRIAQNLVSRRKIEKYVYFTDELFSLFVIVFELIGIRKNLCK